MAENKDLLVGEELEKAIAVAEAEYDDDRIVEKADYVETDERYNQEGTAAAQPEPELSIEEEFPDYIMPIGLQSTFVRGTNRYQLTGAICGYAGYLLLEGLLGITGIYEATNSGFLGPIIGLAVGYFIGNHLSKKKSKQVEEDLARMRAERDAQAAE